MLRAGVDIQYISCDLDNMLNTAETIRCTSNENDPRVFMSIMDMSTPENCLKLQDGWGTGMRRDQHSQMGRGQEHSVLEPW